MEKLPISVVVITRNVEEYIRGCLESVKWADEIVVFDNFSTDKTREICAEYTDKIFVELWDMEGKYRNRAYAQAKNRWILTLDPDERVTPQLQQELKEILNKGTEYTAFSIPMRTYIGNYWIRHGGWYSAKMKAFRNDKFRYEEAEIHPRAFLEGKEGRLKGDIIHYNYRDFAQFIEKTNEQAGLEAKKWLRDRRRMSFWIALRRAIERFIKTYLLKKGFKDGFVGFMVAYVSGLYQILSYAKYWEMKSGRFSDKKDSI